MIRVQNQYKGGTSDYVFGGNRSLVLKAGQTGWISQEEWSTIPMALRGPGGINPIQEGGELGIVLLDYFIPEGDTTQELRYQGTNNTLYVTTDDSTWTVRRYSYVEDDGDFRVSEVQVLQDVPWGADTAARDALPWI